MAIWPPLKRNPAKVQPNRMEAWPVEKVEEAREMAAQGLGCKVISGLIKVPLNTVTRWVKPGPTPDQQRKRALQKVDRERCWKLYLEGHLCPEISKLTGIPVRKIQLWSNNARWQRKRMAQREKIEKQIMAKVEKQAMSMAEQSERVRKRLAAFVDRSAEKVQEMPLKTAKAAMKANKDVMPLIENAAKVFAWGDQPIINVNSLLFVDTRPTAVAAKPVVEIEAAVKDDAS